MESLQSVVNPSGGLLYHWKAIWYHKSLWQSFIRPVNAWLHEWKPARPGLILIGPSGGYCLSLDFLNQFEEIVIVEPDPVARWIFTKRFSRENGAKFSIRHWSEATLFVEDRRTLSPQSFRKLFNAFPNHAVLFSNIIGQLRFLYPSIRESQWLIYFRNLVSEMKTIPFASFHDRYSGKYRPDIDGYRTRFGETRMGTEDFIRVLYESAASRGQSKAQKKQPLKIEVVDHATAHYFSDLRPTYFVWEISPGYFHLIEGVFHRSQ